MIDFIIAGIILGILVAAVVYIGKQKKNGIKCIGCPDSPKCASGGQCAGCNGDCQSSK